jgi:hypothetical protein
MLACRNLISLIKLLFLFTRRLANLTVYKLFCLRCELISIELDSSVSASLKPTISRNYADYHYAEYPYADYPYAEYPYAECPYAECHGADCCYLWPALKTNYDCNYNNKSDGTV